MALSLRHKLSAAQRELLGELAGYHYGEGHITAQGRRTAAVLIRLGLVEPAGPQWVAITEAGREALRDAV